MADTEVPRERVAPKDDRPASDRFRIPERWTITFERIGRNRSVSDLVIFIEDPDDEREMAQVASDIQRHIGGHLGSREWGWYIDDEDNLWIQDGRFGRGAVAVEHLDAVALPSTSGGGS